MLSRTIKLVLSLMLLAPAAAFAQGGVSTPVIASPEPLPNCTAPAAGQPAYIIYDLTAGVLKYCSATNTWTSTGSGSVGTSTQYANTYYSSPNTLSGTTAPTGNGSYTCGYAVSGGVAVAPTCPIVGVAPDALAGATVLYSDNDNVIYNPPSALSLPTPTTLGNPTFFTVIATPGGVAVTLTPVTWTISLNGAAAGATAAIPANAQCSLLVDQIASTQWDVNCVTIGASSGGVTSFTGDGKIITNSGSTGAVTVTLGAPGGSTVGFDGFWNNSLEGGNVILGGSVAGNVTPTNTTMYGTVVTLHTVHVVGHATAYVTAGGSSETLYTCIYTSNGGSLLWSASGTVNSSSAVYSPSATQVVLAPGNYLVTFEQTGSGAAAFSDWAASTPAWSFLNQNGTRVFSTGNLVSASACPTSTGALTKQTATVNFPAILLEP